MGDAIIIGPEREIGRRFAAELKAMKADLDARQDQLRSRLLANSLEELIGAEEAEKVFRMLQRKGAGS